MKQTLYLGRFISGYGIPYQDVRDFAREHQATCIITFKNIRQRIKYFICQNGDSKEDVIIEAKEHALEYAGDEDLYISNFCTVCSKTVSGIPCDELQCPC